MVVGKGRKLSKGRGSLQNNGFVGHWCQVCVMGWKAQSLGPGIGGEGCMDGRTEKQSPGTGIMMGIGLHRMTWRGIGE